MQDKIKILAPAKLNIFLKILGKRNDGYHEIRSGITFINLFDEILIERSSESIIEYNGDFKPSNRNYRDCIIKKTLNFLDIDKDFKFKIKIIKNIPVKGGLGSASTNAASLILALEKMKVIKFRKPVFYSNLGADIPCFLFKKDCLVTGMGEKLTSHSFPKYFFLLIKPRFSNSTKNMYEKLKIKKLAQIKLSDQNNVITDDDSGNDFESIMIKNNIEYNKIIDFLNSFDQMIFARMTGSGSCVFAAFESKEDALNAQLIFKNSFKDLWTAVLHNNIKTNV